MVRRRQSSEVATWMVPVQVLQNDVLVGRGTMETLLRCHLCDRHEPAVARHRPVKIDYIVFNVLLVAFTLWLGYMMGYEANSQVRLIYAPTPKCLDAAAIKKTVYDYSKSICKIKLQGETK